jgi:hypothetical protein
MAVQFMLIGLAGSTVGLVRRDTAAPYQNEPRANWPERLGHAFPHPPAAH